MSEEIFAQTIQFLKNYTSQGSTIEKIKFFWWEPLLRKDLIISTIDQLKENVSEFTLTTNWVLLDRDFCDYAESRGLNITLSLDWDDKTNKLHRISITKDDRMWVDDLTWLFLMPRNVSINQVITAKTVRIMYQNFLYLIQQWFVNFNFLPEYYVDWEKEDLLVLIQEFSKILHYCKEHDEITIQYSNVDMNMWFFNFWIIVEPDGRLYATDLILWKKLEKYKEQLCIGDVWDGINKEVYTEGWLENYLTNIHEYLKIEYSKKTIASVKYIDEVIRSFFKTYFHFKNAN
jgi:MoaA/NifB/PqqE/SkfB family radical SAM enzyme